MVGEMAAIPRPNDQASAVDTSATECSNPPMANLDYILDELKEERDRLDAAIQALEGESRNGARRGRPVGSKSRKRRKMSLEARAKIGAAQRAR